MGVRSVMGLDNYVLVEGEDPPVIDAQVLFGNEEMKARLFIDVVRFKEDLVETEAADKKST